MSSLQQELVARALGACGRSLESVLEHLGDLSRVIHFLRGLAEFRVRSDDIFIVTYPRSGTTLMQFLLYQLTSTGEPEFDHISQVVPWFERSLAVGAIEARDLEAMPSPRIFKSHLAYRWVPKGGRCLYVTRNGRDVAVSYYHFYRSHLGFSGSFEQFFGRFLRGEVQYRSWFKHTAGWLAHGDDPRVLLLSFEDLVTDLPGCIETIARFCGLSVDPGRRAGIAERCGFDYMKQHEHKFAFTTEVLLQRGYQLGTFLRGGRLGEGRETLTPAQEEAFRQAAVRRQRFPELELDLPQFLR